MTETENVYAEYGCIYEWYKEEGDNILYCVVVSSNVRAMDKIISILFLSPTKGHGADVVPVNIAGEKLFAHADLVTYTKREYIHRKMGKVSKDTMKKITTRILVSLNLLERKEIAYEQLYNEMLEALIKRGAL